MAKLTEGKHPGEHVLSEVGMISRDEVTISEGEDLEAGTVLKADGANHVAFTAGATPTGILFAKTDATDADKKAAAHTRLCEVVEPLLVWPDGITDGQKATAVAALATKFVIVRTPVAGGSIP